MTEICDELNRMAHSIEEKDAEIAALKAELDGVEELQQIVKAYEGLAVRENNLKKENDDLREEMERLNLRLEAAGVYLKTARDGWRDTQKERDLLKEENKGLRSSLAAAENSLDRFRKVVWHLWKSWGGWIISYADTERNDIDIAKMQKEMGK